ncbi:MAG: hypothetical protein DMF90_27115, partial [Acidobacteria bacterium]
RVGRHWRIVAVAAAFVIAASTTAAQQRRPGRIGGPRPVLAWASPESMDTGVFQFCRLVFRQAANGDGYGWSVDYPSADENLSTRLSELTRAPISIDESGRPNHVLIRLTQPELFRCPFVMMTPPFATTC